MSQYDQITAREEGYDPEEKRQRYPLVKSPKSADRFTPPPYEASEPGEYGDYDGRCFVITGDDLRIAVVLGDHQEARANAALFTATPDMLAALKEAERLYTSYGLLAQQPECGKWINAARAAIAKATQP